MRIYITTQPRSGTHWLHTLVRDILGYYNEKYFSAKISWTEQNIQDTVENLPDEKVYIFHLVDPAKIIKYITPATDYVFSITRDLKDILTSWYLLLKQSPGVKPRVEAWDISKGGLTDREFVNEWVRDPPVAGLWYQSSKWKMYNNGYTHPNYMLLRYEELHTDTLNQLKNICSFLKISKTDTELNKIITDNSFDTISGTLEDEGKRPFFTRKGIVGDYLNFMDQDVIDLINESIL
ncbi:MAG: sulfotransferase domain-containing protein [Saprospiraceae bacterium]